MARSKVQSVAVQSAAAPVLQGAPAVRATAAELQGELRRFAKPEIAKASAWFFKTGPGEYGEGDQFLGVKVPDVRRIARVYRELPLEQVSLLLASAVHEDRLAGLVTLVGQFDRGDESTRKQIIDLYLASTARINNWDLVDASAPQIVGGWLEHRSRKVLRKLARSANLWERRIGIVATLQFIRHGDFGETLAIAEMLIGDQHDLIHKATGWMLREVGKRDEAVLDGFLDKFAASMPRTMLRYAIERMAEPKRLRYLSRDGRGSAAPATAQTKRAPSGCSRL